MPSVGWPAYMRPRRARAANVITPIGTRRGSDPDGHGRAPAHQVRHDALRAAEAGLSAAHDAHVMAAAWARRRSSRHGDVAAFAVK
jgi:hypothetical protein